MRSLAVFVLLSAALTLAACSQPAGTGSKVDAELAKWVHA